MSRKVLPIVLVALAVALAFPPSARAHGTGSRWPEDAHARVVYFHYSMGEPMAYARIKVFGPGDDKMEFQNARADRNGRFAFAPDQAGAWRVEAGDEEGHRAVAECVVDQTLSAARSGDAPEQPTGSPLWVQAILGASLILNVFGVAAWLRTRRQGLEPRSSAT